MSGQRLRVVSHNIARGELVGFANDYKLSEIYDKTLRFESGASADIICLQEQEAHDGISIAPWIADALGEHYDFYIDTQRFGDPAIIWNTETVTAIARMSRPIPKLEQYSSGAGAFATDEAQQRYVVGVRFRTHDDGTLFDVWSIHLDAWGGNAHKQAQLEAVLAPAKNPYGIPVPPAPENIIVCGDTNIYAPFNVPLGYLQRKTLHDILAQLGLADPGDEPTFNFLKLPGNDRRTKLIKLAARLKLLARPKFDIVATTMPIIKHAVIETDTSDHNPVYAVIDVP